MFDWMPTTLFLFYNILIDDLKIHSWMNVLTEGIQLFWPLLSVHVFNQEPIKID